ncbi:MAG: RimK family alpha-L-glutamate ligase [Phycisphaerales bacterium]
MKLVILSRTPEGPATARLVDVAVARGHAIQIVDVLATTIGLGSGATPLSRATGPIQPADGVIPRIGETIGEIGLAVLRQFEAGGAVALNSADAIAGVRDKLHQLQRLHAAGVPTPRTAFAFRREDMAAAIAQVGGGPVVLKTFGGSGGIGVVLAESSSAALSGLEALQAAGRPAMVQHFHAECRGRDVRALVVDGHVVAAMRRIAAGDEFRGNLQRGGAGEPVALDDAARAMAVAAATTLDLHVAGVDLLETSDGPKVLEVNASPGLAGIEAVTGVDVATAMIEHLEGLVRGVDRNAIGAPPGTGTCVVDITVTEAARLSGGRLDAAGLSARGVTVLSLRRGGRRLAAPAGDLFVQAGDVLTCRGGEATLRAVGGQLGQPELAPVGRAPAGKSEP